jgi:cation diffusion facilitator CzcD-associated flavoprotein CzcO
MTTLVVGASGATGKHLVNQLLDMGQKVKVIVRSTSNLPESWKNNDRVIFITAPVLDIDEEEMANHVKDCQAVASCLGHNVTFKGIYGQPRKLVTDAVDLLCRAVKRNNPSEPVKFVLMNTTGNRNRDLNEPVSFGHSMVVGLLRLILPPHVDNEKAADYLRVNIGQKDDSIAWVAVRPDGLIDEDNVTAYELHPSPIRDPIFNSGKTSRINVGNFMARLIVEDDLWTQWKGQMPVIYNLIPEKSS